MTFWAFGHYLESMKLLCSQSELNAALQLVSRAVASRPTHPVLANVLLTADAVTDRLSLTGFDLNLGIQTSIAAEVKDSGAITLPARLFGEIISRMSFDSPITLTTPNDSEQIELKSKSGSYKMNGLSADDFPELPLVQSGTSYQLDTFSLLSALRGTLFASSPDEAKQLLTGVHLSFIEKSLKAAATDGHRLSVINIENALEEKSSNQELDENSEVFSVTLPSRSLRELERLLPNLKKDEKLKLFYEKGQVVFLSSEQVITTRTLEGTYPNYSQLIPDQFTKSIIIDRKQFIDSLERIAVLADQHNNVIKISTDKSNSQVNITTDAQDVGSGAEKISANIEGEDLQIAFNVRYLLDGLKVIETEKILLRANSSTTPAVICPSEDIKKCIYLVMPIQVRT